MLVVVISLCVCVVAFLAGHLFALSRKSSAVSITFPNKILQTFLHHLTSLAIFTHNIQLYVSLSLPGAHTSIPFFIVLAQRTNPSSAQCNVRVLSYHSANKGTKQHPQQAGLLTSILTQLFWRRAPVPIPRPLQPKPVCTGVSFIVQVIVSSSGMNAKRMHFS